jgi:alpha-N-arabinofuranosidase
VSCHAYYQELDGDLGSFLASALDMGYFIDTVVATADHVGYKKRSSKKMQVSFDEWNVWYLREHQEREASGSGVRGWAHAPRLLEDVYTVADAVVVGNLLMTLLARSDRVTSASLAQLVNVIAPIMTEPGGPAWRQTTFYPFSITSRLASGEVIRPVITSPVYATARHGEAPVIDAIATADSAEGRAAVFLVNRDLSETARVTIDVRGLDVRGLGCTRITEATTLADSDCYARNTLAEPDRVRPAANASADLADGVLTIELPPVSWTAVALG